MCQHTNNSLHTHAIVLTSSCYYVFQLYKFQKAPVPDDHDEKLKMIESLMTFGVSVIQYEKAYKMADITMYVYYTLKNEIQSIRA